MTIEEMQEQLLKAQEELNTLKATNAELTRDKKELTERNDKLVEHNNKLFARISQPEGESQKELTDEQREENLIKEIRDKIKDMN